MFELKDFIANSGITLPYKINCDSLTDEDIETLAWIIDKNYIFKSVYGIPTGGQRLANALVKYISDSGVRLIVDDVLTTGKSMKIAKDKGQGDAGVVIYSRGKCPNWITPIFDMKLL